MLTENKKFLYQLICNFGTEMLTLGPHTLCLFPLARCAWPKGPYICIRPGALKVQNVALVNLPISSCHLQAKVNVTFTRLHRLSLLNTKSATEDHAI